MMTNETLAQKIEDVAQSNAVLAERVGGLANEVGAIGKEVLGNGDSANSIATRLKCLETAVRTCQAANCERLQQLAASQDEAHRGRAAIVAAWIGAGTSIIVTLLGLWRARP